MEFSKVCYVDDDKLIPGILIRRRFRRPVFVPWETTCGWTSQTLTKDTRNRIVPFQPTTPHLDQFIDRIHDVQHENDTDAFHEGYKQCVADAVTLAFQIKHEAQQEDTNSLPDAYDV